MTSVPNSNEVRNVNLLSVLANLQNAYNLIHTTAPEVLDKTADVLETAAKACRDAEEFLTNLSMTKAATADGEADVQAANKDECAAAVAGLRKLRDEADSFGSRPKAHLSPAVRGVQDALPPGLSIILAQLVRSLIDQILKKWAEKNGA